MAGADVPVVKLGIDIRVYVGVTYGDLGKLHGGGRSFDGLPGLQFLHDGRRASRARAALRKYRGFKGRSTADAAARRLTSLPHIAPAALAARSVGDLPRRRFQHDAALHLTVFNEGDHDAELAV